MWVFFAAYLALAPQSRAAEIDVRFSTVPTVTEARPSSDPVKLSLEIAGAVRSSDRVSIRLHAPKSHWLFSTDFPLVEGTVLSDMTVQLSRGKVEWEYVFPIRGVYRLEVEKIAEGQTGVQKVLEIPLKEKRTKLLFLGLFIGLLFAFGFVAGRLFTGRDKTRR